MGARDYQAKDVYPLWRRRVRAARSSIRVYSPYLDSLAVHLMTNAPARLTERTVVTDLSPASSAVTYRAQLLAVRRLLAAGIEVRSQPRLHAKVLLTDRARVTVGSQNFTSYARSSREATVTPSDDLAGTAFVNTLDDWHDTAAVVTKEFVDDLLQNLDAAAKEVRKAAETLLGLYEIQEHAWKERQRLDRARRARQSSVSRRMASVVGATPYQRRSGAAWARLRRVPGGYDTLYAGSDDLTSWPHTDRRFKAITFEYLLLHPILIDPGQMAYARVGQERITYFWDSVERLTPVQVGDRRLWMSVTFPRGDELGHANIHLRARRSRWSSGGVETLLLFNGVDLELVDMRSSSDSELDVALADLLRDAFATPRIRKALIGSVFGSVRPERLGRDKHNAPDYFEYDTTYRIDAVKFEGYPILLATTYDAWAARQQQLDV